MYIAASRIVSVRVHHAGATVSRRVELSPGEPGEQGGGELEVPGLPLSLVDATVRARLEGPGAERFTASRVHVGLRVERTAEPPGAPAAEERERLAHELAVNAEMQDQLRAEIEALEAVPVPARPEGEEGKAPPPSPMAGRQKLEADLELATAERLKELASLREARRDLEERARELAEQERLASSAREVRPEELRKCVGVRLGGEGAVPAGLRLLLDYYVPGARWAPSYQCRMSRDCTRAEIAMRASVCQASGEDWSDVTLELSTAEPLAWTELPELSSVRIGKAQPSRAKRPLRPAPAGASQLFADYDRDRQALARRVRPEVAFSPPAFSAPPTPSLRRSGAARVIAASDDAAPPARASRAQRRSGAPDGEGAAADLLFEEAAPEPMEAPAFQARYAPAYAPPMAMPVGAPPPAPPTAPGYGPPGAAPAAPPGYGSPPPAGFAPPPPPPPAPARPAPRSKTGRPKADASPAAERALEALGAAAAQLPVLTALSLPPADDAAARTRLHVPDLRERYLAGLAGGGLRIGFDVIGTLRLAADAANRVRSQPLPPGSADVRHAAGSFDYAYACEAPVDVPSDGAFHSVPVHVREAESRVVYVVVPREDTSVFRQADVENPIAAPLLPGPVEVFVAGEYVLGTALPLVVPRGRFKLGLGVEQAVKCARNARFREERSGGHVVATAELVHELAIELANNLERSIRCEVRERVPQPAPGAEVVVEERAAEPAWEKYDQSERGGEPLDGGRRWLVELAAGERRELSACYVVKIYANNELVGGNRREA